MSGPCHSWEDAGHGSPLPAPRRRREWDAPDSPEPAARRLRSWEEPALPPPDPVFDHGDDSDEEGAPQAESEHAAEEFAQLLLGKFFDSSLSAETVCNMAYFCTKAGMKGLVEQLGLPPGPGGGNFARHIKRVLGFKAPAGFYKLEVPGCSKYDLGRTQLSLPCLPHPRSLARRGVSGARLARTVGNCCCRR